MLVVALTGYIGSGKSHVASIFRALGIKVFNSDTLAKQAYFNKEIKTQVQALLGKQAYLENQELNKDFIAQHIFQNLEKKTALEKIIHPFVFDKFDQFKKKYAKQNYIIKETALLFQTRTHLDADKIIWVDCMQQRRLSFLKKRDDSSEELVLKKIKSQKIDFDIQPYLDFKVLNEIDESLINQVLFIHEALLASSA